MEHEDYLAQLAGDIEAFADAVAQGPLDAPIAGCPAWTLAELGEHLGFIHRWARAAAATGQPPQIDPAEDPAPQGRAALAEWVRAGGARLVATLSSFAPDDPSWHPFPVPKVGRVWPRRQAQETSVHRWDAEHAIGREAVISAAMAADGIDEYWTVMLPRLVIREHLVLPASTFAIHATDTEQRWAVDGANGAVAVLPAGAAVEATLRGSAEHALLAVWGRPVPDGALHIDGDDAVAAAWLSIGGV